MAEKSTLNMSNDEFMKQLDKDFLSGFTGVPVRVDSDLAGNSFYCAVSQEVFEKLKGLHNG